MSMTMKIIGFRCSKYSKIVLSQKIRLIFVWRQWAVISSNTITMIIIISFWKSSSGYSPHKTPQWGVLGGFHLWTCRQVKIYYFNVRNRWNVMTVALVFINMDLKWQVVTCAWLLACLFCLRNWLFCYNFSISRNYCYRAVQRLCLCAQSRLTSDRLARYPRQYTQTHRTQ